MLAGIGRVSADAERGMGHRGTRITLVHVARRVVVAMLARLDRDRRRLRRLGHRHVHDPRCQDLAEQGEEHDETAMSEARHGARVARIARARQIERPLTECVVRR